MEPPARVTGIRVRRSAYRGPVPQARSDALDPAADAERRRARRFSERGTRVR
ncbi:hypothetical protein [Streptomyces sp. NPDC005930]|uniref:hypothetical protein n=1 Tax=Streptomyces sp. NPDC005930 TaxID=3364736 RepID=UPI003683361F